MLLPACSPPQHKVAVINYQNALKVGNLQQLVTSLKALSEFDNNYQTELNTAENALIHFKKAESELIELHYIDAYLASHKAYRLYPCNQSKELLITIGTKFKQLAKVGKKLKQAFQIPPKEIHLQVEEYKKSSITHWSIIKVNQLVAELTKSADLLIDSIEILNTTETFETTPLINDFKQNLEQQLITTTESINTLVLHSQAESAILLLNLNERLSTKTDNMLAVASPYLAKQNLQQEFFDAQAQYKPFQIINENLSLASSLHHKEIHAPWYIKWQEIEQGVLLLNDDLDSYLKQSKKITVSLKGIAKNSTKNITPTFKYQSFNMLEANNKDFISFLQTLEHDQKIINYGFAKAAL